MATRNTPDQAALDYATAARCEARYGFRPPIGIAAQALIDDDPELFAATVRTERARFAREQRTLGTLAERRQRAVDAGGER